jgi:hypothetical protein
MNRQTKVFLLLHCFYQTQHQILNQEKVSGPNPLNDDYIGYSDIKIRYRWNCTSGFFYFLRPRKSGICRYFRFNESSSYWMLHGNKSIFFSATYKSLFRKYIFQYLSLISESDIVLFFRQCNRERMRERDFTFISSLPLFKYLI